MDLPPFLLSRFLFLQLVSVVAHTTADSPMEPILSKVIHICWEETNGY